MWVASTEDELVDAWEVTLIVGDVAVVGEEEVSDMWLATSLTLA